MHIFVLKTNTIKDIFTFISVWPFAGKGSFLHTATFIVLLSNGVLMEQASLCLAILSAAARIIIADRRAATGSLASIAVSVEFLWVQMSLFSLCR